MACQNKCLFDLLYLIHIYYVFLYPKLYINTRLICTYIYADKPPCSNFQSLLPLRTKYNALKIKEVFL